MTDVFKKSSWGGDVTMLVGRRRFNTNGFGFRALPALAKARGLNAERLAASGVGGID